MNETLLRDHIINAIREAGATQTYWAPGPFIAGIYADAIIDMLKEESNTIKYISHPDEHHNGSPHFHRNITLDLGPTQ